MPRLRRWLDARLDLRGLYAYFLDRKVPDRLTWAHTLGSATLTAFLVLVLSGLVLATYYAPSPDHAFDSVWFIQNRVVGGGLLRGIHKWAASAMVVLILAHMTRVFISGAYKYPREVNWWVGVALFLTVLGFAFTGYLLPWDAKAYWATQVGIGMAGTTPWIGSTLATLLRGGGDLGAATLTRFYAFHTLWLPATLGVLVFVHLGLVIRQGIAPDARSLEEGAPRRTDDEGYPSYYERAYEQSKSGSKRFWPEIIAKDIAVSLAVVGFIVFMAVRSGAGLELPVDPSDTSYVPMPEWYFLPLYQLLTLVPGSMESVVAVGVPTALILSLLALPLVDRRSARRLTRRPLGLAALLVLLGGSGWLIGSASREMTFVAPQQLGRPLPAAARSGRALFEAQGCGDCHSVNGVGGNQGPDLTDIGMRRSTAWIHSFIENPSMFRSGTEMPAFGPPQLSHVEVEELARYLSTLRGDAPADAQPQFADTFPPVGR